MFDEMLDAIEEFEIQTKGNTENDLKLAVTEDSDLAVDDSRFNATRSYLNELRNSKLLTPEQEKFYGKQALNGDQSARKIMIESNLRLVVKICGRYLNRGLPLLDLINEGNLGLIVTINAKLTHP